MALRSAFWQKGGCLGYALCYWTQWWARMAITRLRRRFPSTHSITSPPPRISTRSTNQKTPTKSSSLHVTSKRSIYRIPLSLLPFLFILYTCLCNLKIYRYTKKKKYYQCIFILLCNQHSKRGYFYIDTLWYAMHECNNYIYKLDKELSIAQQFFSFFFQIKIIYHLVVIIKGVMRKIKDFRLHHLLDKS